MDALTKVEPLDFDSYRLDFGRRTLSRVDADGRFVPVAIGARAFDLLSVLVCRAGTIVQKSEIMDAVWPGLAVEESNLTVQVSALRRILDQGREGASCIQTIPGRGYRFVPEVTRPCSAGEQVSAPIAPDGPSGEDANGPSLGAGPAPTDRALRWPGSTALRARRLMAVATLAILLAGLGALGVSILATRAPPRLSIAVLPFSTAGGAPDLAGLADQIAGNLTTDLAQLSGARVSPHQATLRFRDRPVEPQKAARELGVRYVLTGSLSGTDETMRINVELLSGESGAALWMDRLDADVTDRSGQQEEIGGWLSDAAARALVVAEAARSARERPDEPDALDLVLQARAVVAEPASARRWKEAQALFERAVRLDPGSVPALAGLANAIISQATEMGEPLGATDIGRAEELTEAAAAIAPTDPMVVWDRAYLFRVEQRWPEAEAAFEHLLNMYPHITNGVFMLGVCRLQLGRADEAIPLFSKAIRVSPRFPSIWSRYHRMAQALLLSGRYDEAPLWYQRALTADPQLSAGNRADKHYYMASAYALAGHVEKAREQVDEGMSLWPYATARSAMAVFVSNDAFAEQVERVREGLRLAGLRDHVDEDQDFGIGPVSDLQSRLVGETPLTVPGATTIRTMELGALLGSGKLVVIDASEGNRSLPGAILLPEAGRGGSLQDAMQDRLGLFMRRLTGGDLTAQIVTLGINAERWTGYNLALRLIALGYRHVFWYRGGREAWEVAGLHLTRSPPVLLSIR